MSAIAQPISNATYRRGALLITGATLFWSLAGLLARMVATDPWTTLFWRSVCAGTFLLAYLFWRDGRRVPAGYATRRGFAQDTDYRHAHRHELRSFLRRVVTIAL